MEFSKTLRMLAIPVSKENPGYVVNSMLIPFLFSAVDLYVKGTSDFKSIDMALPLCVIDITDKVKKYVHYAATAEDVKAYEAKYGAIPDGAFVALRTDWSKNWPDMNKLSGIAEDGSENFPGWSLDALKYLYETRNAAANGHEALDTDASAEAAKAGDLACERYVLSKNKLQIEVLQNLDRVAPAGALLVAAWPNIKGATGMPVRAFAITPKNN